MISPAADAMFRYLTPLTFGITGLSKDKQAYSALGTGSSSHLSRASPRLT